MKYFFFPFERPFSCSQMFIGAASALMLGGVAAGALAIGIICPLLWIGAAVRGHFPKPRS